MVQAFLHFQPQNHPVHQFHQKLGNNQANTQQKQCGKDTPHRKLADPIIHPFFEMHDTLPLPFPLLGV